MLKPRRLQINRNKQPRSVNRGKKRRLAKLPRLRKKLLTRRRLRWIRRERSAKPKSNLNRIHLRPSHLRPNHLRPNHRHPNPHQSLYHLSPRKKRRNQNQRLLLHHQHHHQRRRKKRNLHLHLLLVLQHQRWTPLSSKSSLTTQLARSKMFVRQRRKPTKWIPTLLPIRLILLSSVSLISLVTAATRSKKSQHQLQHQCQLQHPRLRSRPSQKQ